MLHDTDRLLGVKAKLKSLAVNPEFSWHVFKELDRRIGSSAITDDMETAVTRATPILLNIVEALIAPQTVALINHDETRDQLSVVMVKFGFFVDALGKPRVWDGTAMDTQGVFGGAWLDCRFTRA